MAIFTVFVVQYPFLDASSHPSVCPYNSWSMTLSSKSRKINIFDQINDRGGKLGSLYASLHLYKMVYWSVMLL